jgi:hypothetical protein
MRSIVLALLLTLVPAAAGAQPADYKVAFWYRRAAALSTMRHQVYDLHQGQYTAAVDAWLRTMHTTWPDHVAYVKDFRLDPKSTDSATKQLATMILREYRDKGGPNGGYGVRDARGIYGEGGLSSLIGPPRVGTWAVPALPSGASTYHRGYGFLNSPGANRPPSYALPPATTSPFPYPYVRPHP